MPCGAVVQGPMWLLAAILAAATGEPGSGAEEILKGQPGSARVLSWSICPMVLPHVCTSAPPLHTLSLLPGDCACNAPLQHMHCLPQGAHGRADARIYEALESGP